MKKTAVIVSIAVLIVSSLSLQAKSDRFEKWDTDGDGMVTEAEVVARSKKPEKAAKRFKKYDANGDGFLTKEEMALIPEDKKGNRGDMGSKDNEENMGDEGIKDNEK